MNLIFSGDGSIEIINGDPFVVDCTEAVTVNGGEVKISGANSALCLDGALTVNGGSLELIASDEDAKAIDAGWEQPDVVLGENMVMRTGTNPNGSDAKETAVTEIEAIKAARYIKIAGKTAPAGAGNYYYRRTDEAQPSPKTADAGAMGLWCMLLLGSGAVLPATLRRRKSGRR